MTEKSRFDDCNAKLYLNSECYPYDLNLHFDKNRCAILYDLRVSARATTDSSISSLTFTTFLRNS